MNELHKLIVTQALYDSTRFEALHNYKQALVCLNKAQLSIDALENSYDSFDDANLTVEMLLSLEWHVAVSRLETVFALGKLKALS